MALIKTKPAIDMFGQDLPSRTHDIERGIEVIAGTNRYTGEPVQFEVMKSNGHEFVVLWDGLSSYRDAQFVTVGIEELTAPNTVHGTLEIPLGPGEWGGMRGSRVFQRGPHAVLGSGLFASRLHGPLT